MRSIREILSNDPNLDDKVKDLDLLIRLIAISVAIGVPLALFIVWSMNLNRG